MLLTPMEYELETEVSVDFSDYQFLFTGISFCSGHFVVYVWVFLSSFPLSTINMCS